MAHAITSGPKPWGGRNKNEKKGRLLLLEWHLKTAWCRPLDHQHTYDKEFEAEPLRFASEARSTQFTCPIRGHTEQELSRQLPRPQLNPSESDSKPHYLDSSCFSAWLELSSKLTTTTLASVPDGGARSSITKILPWCEQQKSHIIARHIPHNPNYVE
jgi:hypothetical protein